MSTSICGIKLLRKNVTVRYVREVKIFNAEKQYELFVWMIEAFDHLYTALARLVNNA